MSERIGDKASLGRERRRKILLRLLKRTRELRKALETKYEVQQLPSPSKRENGIVWFAVELTGSVGLTQSP